MTQMQTLKAELMQSNNIYQTQKARLTGSEAGEGQNEKTSNTGKQIQRCKGKKSTVQKADKVQKHRSKDGITIANVKTNHT